MRVSEKIAATQLNRGAMIRYKFGRISGVKFKRTKRLRWNDYEVYDGHGRT